MAASPLQQENPCRDAQIATRRNSHDSNLGTNWKLDRAAALTFFDLRGSTFFTAPVAAMADALPSPDSKGVVDESLKQRLKQPRRHEIELDTPKTEASTHKLMTASNCGQTMRGDH